MNIPDVAGLSNLDAALAYAVEGIFVGPIRHRSKHPGGILGDDWDSKTSRDPEVINGWFEKHHDRGVFIHVGRSGLLVFDVDTPESLHPLIARAVDECDPPWQSTRPTAPDRRHLVFAQPEGRSLGNSHGTLGRGWGEVRGLNGIIVVAPSVHEQPDGAYAWGRAGRVPVLPEYLAHELPDALEADSPATDAEVEAFLQEHTASDRPAALAVHALAWQKKVAEGESRHDSLAGHLTGAMKEAAAGLYPALAVVEAFEGRFKDAVSVPGIGGKQGQARSPGNAAQEWNGLLRWAVAQAVRADPDATLARSADRVPGVVQDFAALPTALVPAPDRYVGTQGLLTEVLAGDIARHVTYAVDARDRSQFYVYRDGRWDRGGVTTLTEATVVLLHNRFRKSHLTNVLTALGNRPGVREIDGSAAPRWINVENGLLDWRTGTLHPHSPDVLSTVQLPVHWRPDAVCPAFEKFLREVLPSDCVDPLEGGPGFIWELLGYCLYSGNPHHVAVLLYGNGRNGKGALLRVLLRLVGARNASSVPLHELSENRFRSATLYGRLINVAGDLDARWLANTAMFKAITGEDVVQAENKYGAPFDFMPWALPVYSTNKAFGSADSSEGYLARWVVVPFPNSFLGREDRHLDERLQREGELEGVLRRAAQALPVLMDRGRLPEPESVKAAKHRFIVSGDSLRSWLDECCDLGRDLWTARTELWWNYEDCSADAGSGGRYLLSKREFYNRLAQVGGLRESRRNGRDGFAGVRLKQWVDPDPDPQPEPEDLL